MGADGESGTPGADTLRAILDARVMIISDRGVCSREEFSLENAVGSSTEGCHGLSLRSQDRNRSLER